MNNKNNSNVEISNNSSIIENQDNKTADKDSKKKKKNPNQFIGTLKYGIAALSLVSFITTSDGLQEIIKDNKFIPFLISFGIQMIVLIVGTQFVNII